MLFDNPSPSSPHLMHIPHTQQLESTSHTHIAQFVRTLGFIIIIQSDTFLPSLLRVMSESELESVSELESGEMSLRE